MISSLNATGAAIQTINVAQSGGIIIVRDLVAAFAGLTPVQIANIAATQGLSEAQLKAIMWQAKYSDEIQKEILLHYAAAQAGGAHTGANNALAFSFKNLWAVMKANPLMLVLSVASILLPLLIKAADHFTTTADEMRDHFNDASSEVQKFESEISALSSELDAVTKDLNKLYEASESGTLTPNQEQEMQNLKARKEELQKQLEIQEKLEAYAAKEASDAAEAAAKKTTYSIGTGEMTMTDDGVWMVDGGFVDGARAITWYTEQMQNAYAKIDELRGQMQPLAEDDPKLGELNSQVEELEQSITGYQAAVADIIPEQQAWAAAIIDENNATKIAINGAIDGWHELEAAHEVYVAVAEETKDAIIDVEAAIGNFSTAVESMEKINDLLDSLKESGSSKLPIDIYDEIINLYPEAAAEISNVAEAQAFLNKKMEDLRGTAEMAYGQIRISNEDWVTDTVKSSEILRKNLSTLYKDDLGNFNDLAKQKWLIEKGLVEDLMTLWSKYISYTTPEIEAMLHYENYEAFNPNDDRIRELQNILEIRKKMEADFDDLGDFSSNSSGKSAAEEAAERARKAFELEYNAWKYKLDMEQITLEEFYDWLGGQDGYQKYFKAQGETLEDFRKYSKEVFDGLRQVHEEYLDYLDFEIERLERQEDSEGAVIAKLSEKRAEVHKLAAELRAYLTAAGMSEIEILSNDQYRSYMDMIHSIEDEVASIQEKIYEESQGHINNLIDLTEEYVKKLAEDEIDALEEQKELYAELLDAKMKMINSARAEEKYERDKAEKLKEMQKLQERITALGRVGTREALLEQGQLIEELNAKQIELDDLQKDKYIENTEEAFDKAKTDFEKEKDAEIKILKDFIDNNEAVNQAALKRLDNMNADLYDKLEDYASHYTETTKAELLEMWEAATKAAEKYGSVTNASKVYEDGDASNEVQKAINKMRENGQAWARTTDGNVRQQLADESLKQGKKLQELLGVPVWRDKNGVWWIDSGSGKKELFSVFHTGTPNVGGNATLKQNEVFAKLDKSESVFTAKHVDKIWEVLQAVNPAKWLSSPLSKFTSRAIQKETPPAPINIEVNTGLELYGKLDDSVMDVLDRHGRDVANLVASKIRR